MPFSGFRRSLAQVERAVDQAEQQHLGPTYIVRLIEQFFYERRESLRRCVDFGVSPENLYAPKTKDEKLRERRLVRMMARQKRAARPKQLKADAAGVAKKQSTKATKQVSFFLHIFYILSFFCAARPIGPARSDLVTFLQQQCIRQHVCIMSPLKSPQRVQNIVCVSARGNAMLNKRLDKN